MLKITVQKGSGEKVIKLEGKLVQPWIKEFEAIWQELLAARNGSALIVDLRSVTYAGEDGKQVLRQAHQAGARLLASGPLMSSIVKQINDEATKGGKHNG